MDVRAAIATASPAGGVAMEVALCGASGDIGGRLRRSPLNDLRDNEIINLEERP
jgi:hypothetical protein